MLANVWRVPLAADRRVTWADARQLTSDEAFIEFVDVSPDGSELFVSSNRRGNQDIWRMPAGAVKCSRSHPILRPTCVRRFRGTASSRVILVPFRQSRHLDHASGRWASTPGDHR